MSSSRYVANFIRQLTKPSLDKMKQKATNSHFLENYIGMPVGKALLFLGRNFTPLTIATGMLMAMLYQNAKNKAREKEMEELNERLSQLEV